MDKRSQYLPNRAGEQANKLARCNEEIERLTAEIERLTAENARKWISVEDRLPPEDTKVLVAIDVNNDGEQLCVGIAHQKIQGGTWYDEETDGYGDYIEWYSEISHWMPLPTHPVSNGQSDE